jgi:hypothetical protein
VTSYASLTDAETFGLVASAYGLSITSAQIQSNLDASSGWAAGMISGRYSMPILPPYPLPLVQAVVHMARYNILAVRGFDENNPADKNVVAANATAREWLLNVRRQAADIDGVIESPAPTSQAQPQYADPLIVSSPLEGFGPSTRRAVVA